jgi:phosphoribosylamine--glycine ligase
MLTEQGPKVLEFNARFGDPETQVYLPRLENDLLEVMQASVEGRLDNIQLRWRPEAALCVVMASVGYPGTISANKSIQGLHEAGANVDTKIFCAGVAQKDGQMVTSGGRVLAVTAWDLDLRRASQKAYETVAKIQFDGAQFRRDIGAKAFTQKVSG